MLAIHGKQTANSEKQKKSSDLSEWNLHVEPFVYLGSNEIYEQVANKVMSEQWKTYTNLIFSGDYHVNSLSGTETHLVFAAPIGFRPISPLQNYSLVALLFFGIGCTSMQGADHKEISDTKLADMVYRHLRVHVLHVAALQFGEIRGEIRGKEGGVKEAMRAFAHEIKAVGYGATTGWLVTPARWNDIRKGFKRDNTYQKQLEEYQIAPVPNLYSSLGTTLMLWSMSYDPVDLFQSRDVPNDLAALADVAWRYARDSHFISLNVRKNFASVADHVIDVIKAWENHTTSDSRKIDCSNLRNWSLRKRAFTADDGRIIPTEANTKSFEQLSALLRVLVVVCENFLHHAKNDSELLLRANCEKDHFSLICSNAWPESDDSTTAIPNHLGFRGIQLIQYLCREYLNGQAKQGQKDEECYRLTISLPVPKWLS